MKPGDISRTGVGEIISSTGKFLARFKLTFSLVDLRTDSIKNAPLESIAGSVTPVGKYPVAIYQEAELQFETGDGLKFGFAVSECSLLRHQYRAVWVE